MSLILNNICILIFFLLFVIVDMIFRYCKKEIKIFNQILLIASLNILITFLFKVDIKIILHNAIIFITMYIAYLLFLINIKENSPTLTLIGVIFSKQKTINFFKKKFVDKKINFLIKQKFIKKDKENYIYTKKNYLYFKILIGLKKISKMRDNG